jgi:hypothetical protein
MHPTGKRHSLAGVRKAKFVAMMSAFHVQTTDERIRGCSKALSENPSFTRSYTSKSQTATDSTTVAAFSWNF